MKYINTLIPDIYEMVGGRNGWLTSPIATELSNELALKLSARSSDKRTNHLRLSQMGDRCPCALWHSLHRPDDAELLPAWAHIKFAYGDILESLVLAMVKASGHEITGEQDELVLSGVSGHRDAVIDGCTVDVKSSSSRSFEKFSKGTIATSDAFGYLDQLDGYILAAANDPLVRVRDRGYLLAVDKTLGHLALYEHRLRREHILKRIDDYKRISDLSEAPACTCKSVPDGVSGNMKLDMKASYNVFKYSCKPNVRTFLYASGPVYLTKVVRLPNVTEIDKNGKVIYAP